MILNGICYLVILFGKVILYVWCSSPHIQSLTSIDKGFNDWGGRGYDDFVPEEVTKTAPSGDKTT